MVYPINRFMILFHNNGKRPDGQIEYHRCYLLAFVIRCLALLKIPEIIWFSEQIPVF